MTLFPQPNAPGMAQISPKTEGKRASRTRCPVSSGVPANSFDATGQAYVQAKSKAWYLVFSHLEIQALRRYPSTSIDQLVQHTWSFPQHQGEMQHGVVLNTWVNLIWDSRPWVVCWKHLMNSLMHGLHLLANQIVHKNKDKILSKLRGQLTPSMVSFPMIKAMKHMVPIEHKVKLPYPEPSDVFDNGKVKKGWNICKDLSGHAWPCKGGGNGCDGYLENGYVV